MNSKPDSSGGVHARDEQPAAAVWKHIDSLVPWVKNPKRTEEGIPGVAKLIVKFGFGAAMMSWLDPDTSQDMIVAGHTRQGAVKYLQRALPKLTARQRAKWHPDAIRVAETGMVPVRERNDLTRSQAEQLAIADNKANEWAPWDDEKLPDVLSDMSLEDVEDLGFDSSDLEKMADDAYGLGDTRPKRKGKGKKKVEDPGFSVVIECDSEERQLEVIEWAQSQELKCRALI